MKVSIITVSYNAVKTIEQTILSVLRQTYANIEYILIDGQSTDGTLDIIKNYAEYIDCVISEPDNGIYDAMNKGIRHATGDIIGFVNSDDWYELDIIEKIVSCFVSTKAEITHGLVWVVDTDGNRVKTNGFEREKVEYEQLYYRMLPHLSVFGRRAVFEQYGVFDTGYPIAADYDWILRCYTGGVRFRYMDDIVGSFRRGGVSTRTEKLGELAEENRNISLKYVSHCKNRERVLYQIEKKYKLSKFFFLAEAEPAKIADVLENAFPEIAEGVAIFGTGNWGERLYRIMRFSGVPVNLAVDNSAEKWGWEFHGIPVKSPESLKNYSGYVLIAVLNHGDEIGRQLFQLNNEKMRWVDLEKIVDMNYMEYR